MANTPNLDLEEPAHGSPNWDTPLNSNFTKIDAGAVVKTPTADQTIVGANKLINQGSELTGDDLSGFNDNVRGTLVASPVVAITGASLNHSPFNVGIQGVAQGVSAFGGFAVAAYDATTDAGETPIGFEAGAFLTSTVNYSAGPYGVIGQASASPATSTTMGFAVGVYGSASDINSGTVTKLVGVRAGTNIFTSDGQPTNSYGFDALLQNAGTTNAAFHSVNQGSGASNYGILLEGVTHNDLGGGQTKVGGLHITLAGVQIFANNAAAIGGGLVAGDIYRTGGNPDILCIVH